MLSQRKEDEIVITAYFTGTGGRINASPGQEVISLATYLNQFSLKDNTHEHYGFDGCGITHGVFGAVFGTGLEKDVDTVANKVIEQLNLGKKVTLNCFGHSRGGIAALLLAKKLANQNPEKLEINLALADPVPGNSITSSELDFFNVSLANQVKDLSSCATLKNVLCLYPYEPISSFLLHAPLIPLYPAHCNVKNDVTDGCHSGAQLVWKYLEHKYRFTETWFVSYVRIKSFLEEHGTQFNERTQNDDDLAFFLEDKNNKYIQIQKDQFNDTLIKIYSNQNQKLQNESNRDAHANARMKITATPNQPFFNLHHKELCQDKEKKQDHSDCTLRIEPSNGLHVSSVLKWLAIGAIISTVIFFTGGFAAIPLLVGLGAAAIAAAMPVIAVGAAALWNMVVKPIAKWCKGEERPIIPQVVVATSAAPAQLPAESKSETLASLSSTAIVLSDPGFTESKATKPKCNKVKLLTATGKASSEEEFHEAMQIKSDAIDKLITSIYGGRGANTIKEGWDRFKSKDNYHILAYSNSNINKELGDSHPLVQLLQKRNDYVAANQSHIPTLSEIQINGIRAAQTEAQKSEEERNRKFAERGVDSATIEHIAARM